MADDRISCHVSATEWGTNHPGWKTYGASRELTSSERRDLPAALPIAGPLRRIADCPRLGGAGPVEVLRPENYKRLRFAFGEAEGKLAFSVWGRLHDGDRSRVPWRVMTLTLLFDQSSFRMISGNPEGLLARIREREGRRVIAPSRWFAAVSRELFQDLVVLPTPPINSESTASLQQDRLMRLGWMADLLARAVGGRSALSEQLGLAYRTLYHILRVSTSEFLVLPDPGESHQSLFARFVWLSLPLADRSRISFQGEVLGADQVRSQISVVPAGRCPRPIPDNWILFEPNLLPEFSSGPDSLQAYARSVCGIGDPLGLVLEEPALAEASLFEGQAFGVWYQERGFQLALSEEPTLSGAFDEIVLEGALHREVSQTRVTALGGCLEQGARAELGGLAPEGAADRLLQPLPGLDAPARLKDRCAIALLEQLSAAEDPWGTELAVLLATGWVIAPSGPNVLGWFSETAVTRPGWFEPLTGRPGTASQLLRATGQAVLASMLSLSEAKTGLLSLLFRAPSPVPETLIAGIETPRDGPELRWALGILDWSIGRAPRDLVLKKFLESILGTPAGEAAEVVAGEFRLLSFAAEQANVPELSALLEKVRPRFQDLWRSFDARMWGLDGAESGESWARLLRIAGWDLETPSPTEFEATGFLAWVLASESWGEKTQRGYELLADWMASRLEAPADYEPIARRVVNSRCVAGRVMSNPELELVAASVRLLGAAGSLDTAMGRQLAQSSTNAPGAPLIWAEAWQSAGGGRDDPGHEVLKAFSTAAAVQVRSHQSKGEALDEALMVSWIEYSTAGSHTFLELVLPSDDPESQRRIVELLERTPPPPIYAAIRRRAQELGPFPRLTEGKSRYLRARVTEVAPALVALFPAPTRRQAGPGWARWLGWNRVKSTTHR